MYRKIVEWKPVVETTKTELPINPSGRKTYLFQSQEEIAGIPCDGRAVCLVESEDDFNRLMEKSRLFREAEDLEAVMEARSMIDALLHPMVAEALAETLEVLGFVRNSDETSAQPAKRARAKKAQTG